MTTRYWPLLETGNSADWLIATPPSLAYAYNYILKLHIVVCVFFLLDCILIFKATVVLSKSRLCCTKNPLHQTLPGCTVAGVFLLRIDLQANFRHAYLEEKLLVS